MSNEPRHTIKDPNSCGFCPTPSPGGDEFDKFLRLTGGDPAKPTGHPDSIKAHAAKVAIVEPEVKQEYYMGPVGIIPAVYKQNEMPMPMSAPAVASTKRRKR